MVNVCHVKVIQCLINFHLSYSIQFIIYSNRLSRIWNDFYFY